MNIAFFLTPKIDIICLKETNTMRQAMEKMERHRFSSVPLIDSDGKYIGTITEGDLLWKLKNDGYLGFEDVNKIYLYDVPRHRDNKAVSIDTDINSIICTAMDQNFVPVVDDGGFFIGIVKRSDIITYCYNLLIKDTAKKQRA